MPVSSINLKQLSSKIVSNSKISNLTESSLLLTGLCKIVSKRNTSLESALTPMTVPSVYKKILSTPSPR